MAGRTSYESSGRRDAIAGVEVPTALLASIPRSASGSEIAQFVALRASACVGADYSNLGLIDSDDRSTLRLYHGAFLVPEVADRYVDVPLDAAFPITTAIRTGKTVVLEGAEAFQARFPEIWEDTRAAGIEATVSVPLTRTDGSLIGAIGFAWATLPNFGVKLDNALQAVAQLVTEIIERAELFEAEHQLIADLHLRLLGDLPTVEGLVTAARYQPAGHSASIGGDWFEGLVLDDGRFAIVVGDVTGHGLAAAADMALIRGMITALLHDGVDTADVFSHVSRVLSRRPEDLLATAALVVIDLATSTLTYTTAGHPPPLMVLPDASVTLLDRANAPILGVDLTRQTSAVAPFPPGSRLVMYTDGLVERRDRPFTAGIEEAVAIFSRQSVSATPAEDIQVLIQALTGDSLEGDDIAVVVVKHVA